MDRSKHASQTEQEPRHSPVHDHLSPMVIHSPHTQSLAFTQFIMRNSATLLEGYLPHIGRCTQLYKQWGFSVQEPTPKDTWQSSPYQAVSIPHCWNVLDTEPFQPRFEGLLLSEAGFRSATTLLLQRT